MNPHPKEHLQNIYSLKDSTDESLNVADFIKNEAKKKNEVEKERVRLAKQNVIITTGCDLNGYKITRYIDVIFEEKIIGVGLKTSIKRYLCITYW